MDPEQAWNYAISQLQPEMSKASFDSWVRDTHLVSFEAGLFTIGVGNEFARDWLENRLTQSVSRLLMGIMNQEVEVQFVVQCQDRYDEGDDTEEEDETAQDDTIEIAAMDYDDAYQSIAHPDRAVYLPGYFRRWLRVIGPDLAWMYVAFRQAAYQSGGRSGKRVGRFSGGQIASMCGTTERTYWNRIGKDSTWQKLAGMLRRESSVPEWVPQNDGSTPRRLPVRYSVAMTLPLTPADSGALRRWLVAHIKEDDCGPENLLRKAAVTPLGSLLSDPPSEDCEALTVRQLIRDVFSGMLPDDQLDGLAAAIQNHIMPPKDLIVIPLFFLEHVLPHLGSGPGWMLTLLRDRCWVDPDTGETRNRVTVQGGYAEVAGWMGLTRPLTVYEWLYGKYGKQAKETGKFKHPVTRVYLREVGKGKAIHFNSSPREFEVLLDDIPNEILEAALAGKPFDLSAIFSIVEKDPYADFSIGFTRLSYDPYATFSVIFTRFSVDLYATCRVFKALNSLNQTPISKDSPPAPPIRNLPAKIRKSRVGNQAYWDFEFLMTNNQVLATRQIKEKKQETGASIGRLAAGFVSWLLYGYATGANDPVALASKRLRENVQAGAGGDFDRLARLRPFELKSQFDRNMSGVDPGDSLETEIYSLHFNNLDQPKKRQLYRSLFGG